MDSKHFLLLTLLCGLAWAEKEPSVSDALNKLPPELQGKVNASDIEALRNKSQALFKEKCEKNGGSEAFAAAQKAYEVFPNCVKNAFNVTYEDLEKQIDEAKPTGAVDDVFKTYCGRTPEAKQCFKDMSEAVKPCFSKEEQNNLKTVYNVTEQLAEFICYKDGDRIALFIAEGGPECFQDKQEQIQTCVNKTLGPEYNIDTNNITANVIPQIAFGEKECQQMSDLQTCIVGALESCKAPTSANIVESLFKFVRQATPCKLQEVVAAKKRSQADETKTNSASGLSVTSMALLLTLVTALY